jgi:dTDP-4-dehydrorhamnose reductase
MPDMAHAALDILIDGEIGIWHLTNDTPVTPSAFASLASALLSGAPDGALIRPGETHGPAVVRCHALGSERGHLMRPLAPALSAYFDARTRLTRVVEPSVTRRRQDMNAHPDRQDGVAS